VKGEKNKIKKLVLVELLAASLLLPTLLFAQSDFDGTWKIARCWLTCDLQVLERSVAEKAAGV
jgi:hypothetical protein